MLYTMWANFQRDISGKVLKIPWIAVADILLSCLCNEIGYELYEMGLNVRNLLLSELKNDPKFGNDRIQELSIFCSNMSKISFKVTRSAETTQAIANFRE